MAADELFAFAFRNSTMRGLVHSVDVGGIFEGDTLTEVPGTAPVAHPDPQFGVRDPSVIRIGNTFWMTATRALVSNYLGTQTAFSLYASTDLRTWTLQQDLDPDVPDSYRVFAPELFCDDDGQVYVYYAVSTQDVDITRVTQFDIYCRRATDSTLATWGPAVLMSGISASTTPGAPAEVIDAQVTRIGPRYVMFVKDEVDMRIMRAWADSPLGPWTLDRTGNWLDIVDDAGDPVDVEGPQLVPMPGGGYRLYYDRYADNILAYKSSPDLDHWSAEVPLSYRYTDLRHPGYLWLSEAEREALLGSTSVGSAGAGTTVPADDGVMPPYPPEWHPGDVMTVLGAVRSPGGAGPTVEPPEGWTVTRYAGPTDADDPGIWVATRVAAQVDDVTPAFAIRGTSSTGTDVVAAVVALRGAVEDVTVGPVHAPGTGTTLGPVPGVDVEPGGAALLVCAVVDDPSSAHPVAPPGWEPVLPAVSADGSGPSVAAFLRSSAAGGVTPPTTIAFDPPSAARRVGVQIAVAPARPQAVADTFTRTGPTTPGTSDTGHAWRVEQGTWGTDGATLGSVTEADNDVVTIPARSLTQDVSAVVTTGVTLPGAYPAVLARWSRMGGTHSWAGWWYALEIAPDGSVLMVRPGALLAATAAGVVPGGRHRIRITVNEEGEGTRIRGYVDGIPYVTARDNGINRPMGQRVGVRHGAADAAGLSIRYDDFTVNYTHPSLVAP